MQLPTLYKRNVNGTVQRWWIEIEGNQFRTNEGLVALSNGEAGAITTSKWTTCSGKNTGRSNATTDEQQAELEARSKWQKKLDRGYVQDMFKVDDLRPFFEPMLAVKYADVKAKLKLPVFVQPKLDGIRCIVRSDGMWSRTGEPILSAPHVFEALKPVFDFFPNVVFDGELYNHELKSDFEKIISLARKSKPTQEDLDESAKLIQYHVYDFVNLDDTSLNFSDRFSFISGMGDPYDTLWSHSIPKPDCVHIVFTDLVETQDYLDLLHGQFMEQGYEGQIIRVNSTYEHKRSKHLIKRKEFDDDEFEIVDVLEGIGNRSGMAGKLQMKKADGTLFKAGIKGGEAFYARLLQCRGQLRGRMATIRYQGLTSDGIPRFPVAYAIRDYE